MDLLALERKLDSTIMRKRLDIQEALKRPQKVKRKLRIFISNHFTPAKKDEQGNEVSKVGFVVYLFYKHISLKNKNNIKEVRNFFF